MLAGCLPLLLQLPFFSIMYRLFLSKTVGGQANALLSRDLLATPLGSHWLTGAGPASAQGLLFLGLFALLAGVGFLTARATRAAGPAAALAPDQPGRTWRAEPDRALHDRGDRRVRAAGGGHLPADYDELDGS